MMIALAGSILKVIDSKNATAPTGPSPGRTPTKVPTKVPRKQKSKFIGVNATDKPRAKLCSNSTLDTQNPSGQGHAQEPGEKAVGDQ